MQLCNAQEERPSALQRPVQRAARFPGPGTGRRSNPIFLLAGCQRVSRVAGTFPVTRRRQVAHRHGPLRQQGTQRLSDCGLQHMSLLSVHRWLSNF